MNKRKRQKLGRPSLDPTLAVNEVVTQLKVNVIPIPSDALMILSLLD